MTIRNDTTGEIRQAVQEHYGRRARLVIDLADVTPALGGRGRLRGGELRTRFLRRR